MAAGYPSGSNTFLPSFEASGQLQIEFSRNPKDFPINRYVKQRKVTKEYGEYLSITAAEAARIPNTTNISDNIWPDGNAAPTGDDNKESFQWLKYHTARYAFPFALGQKSVDQAAWDIIASHARIAAQKAMTGRTAFVHNALGTTGNWSGNTGSMTSVAGGKITASTSTTLYFQSLVQNVMATITKNTLGVAKRDDIMMVMNPDTAIALSKSSELFDTLKQSIYALSQLTFDKKSQNGKWGLPDQLYGVEIVVDDTVVVTTRKGITVAPTWSFPAGDIVFCTKTQGMRGSEGVADFSTFQLFIYEDMTVESKVDIDQRRTMGRVVDDFDLQVVAPSTGFLATSCT